MSDKCLGKDVSNKAEALILDGSKICYHREILESYLNRRRVAPITIECAITTICNYKCIFCSKKFEKIEDQITLPENTVKEFLQDAKGIGVKAVSFIGDGENTCSPFLTEAIKYGKSLGLDMALGTNGSLLNKDMLEEILPNLTYIRFSICAADEERYKEIHGTNSTMYHAAINAIKTAASIKVERNLDVTIGLQMVLMPEFKDQIIPLAQLGSEIKGVDYLVIKHCSDGKDGEIGVDYEKYTECYDLLKEAEKFTNDFYQVRVKWSKIKDGKERRYSKCYAAPLLVQMSGSGLVAPCGPLFAPEYSKLHLGNIREERLKDLFESEKWWSIMDGLMSGTCLNPQTDCAYLCLQHNTNNTLYEIIENGGRIPKIEEKNKPMHINFV